jgi:signal transduction histidine kinase
VDLNELILSVKELLSGTISKEITVKISCPNELWQIHVDPIQIELALLNIVINARDAMPNGGSIDVAAWNITEVKERPVNRSKLRPGDYVVIAVSDTGSGMAPEVIERAFEPFFTTKEIGKGTGLGLSMVYGFVE